MAFSNITEENHKAFDIIKKTTLPSYKGVILIITFRIFFYSPWNFIIIFISLCDNYKLMHTLFHIRTVIIPRDRYRPEGFSPRVDIGWGMIIVLIWKKACINLLITYFNIELKRTKLISHTHTHTPNYEWLISVEGW